jgi:hypothetical protein
LNRLGVMSAWALPVVQSRAPSRMFSKRGIFQVPAPWARLVWLRLLVRRKVE